MLPVSFFNHARSNFMQEIDPGLIIGVQELIFEEM